MHISEQEWCSCATAGNDFWHLWQKQTNKQNYHKHNNHRLSGGNNKKQGNFHHQDFLIKVSKQDNE